jgi:Domain of unknown function (DUF4249)
MKSNIFLLLCLAMLSLACEDVIQIETEAAEQQLAIDAWITDESKPQTIKLSLTQPYFEKGPIVPAKGATVFVVSEDSIPYAFRDLKNDGNYVWTPEKPGDKILEVGKEYLLYVQYEKQEYISISKVNRVPPIDSINYFKEKFPVAPPGLRQEGYQADFYARDFRGEGDCYWIRVYRNDTLFNKPSQIQVAYDAGFSPGSKADGLLFIIPLRASASPELYLEKDRVKVELYSIPQEAFFFLQIVRTESTNGGIFATVPGNIPSNIRNRDEKSKIQPLGFFGVSAVSSLSTVIDPKKAIPKPSNR